MIVVAENLRLLIQQHNIVDDPAAFDGNSITLHLAKHIKEIGPPSPSETVTYGNAVPDGWIKEITIGEDGYEVPPRGAVLGCSTEKVNMPPGYLGLMQTKGSLARLFVMVHCCDGQVDPGYSGRLTFEICNLAHHTVRFHTGDEVAQLFVFKTSTKLVEPYSGRYQGAKTPTHFLTKTNGR